MKRLILGIAIGAGAMYLLDPENGAERRSRLLGFYSENKDTFQEYAQTATQTAVTVGRTAAESAVTVGQTVGGTAGAVADKAADKASGIASKAEKAAAKAASKSEDVIEKAAAAMANGTNGTTAGNVDSLLENRNVTRKSRDAGSEEAPGTGGPAGS